MDPRSVTTDVQRGPLVRGFINAVTGLTTILNGEIQVDGVYGVILVNSSIEIHTTAPTLEEEREADEDGGSFVVVVGRKLWRRLGLL